MGQNSKSMGMVMCKHSLSEQDFAVADGLCPLCLQQRLAGAEKEKQEISADALANQGQLLNRLAEVERERDEWMQQAEHRRMIIRERKALNKRYREALEVVKQTIVTLHTMWNDKNRDEISSQFVDKLVNDALKELEK